MHDTTFTVDDALALHLTTINTMNKANDQLKPNIGNTLRVHAERFNLKYGAGIAC